MKWIARLEELSREYELPDGAAQRLALVLQAIRDEPNAPTTVTDPRIGVETHIADSLSGLLLPELRAARRIADIGAGPGFPGLPLAIGLPHAQVWLVESQGRKCAFLETAIETADVPNAHIVCSRAEDWAERELDVVCVRAVDQLSVTAEYAAPLLRMGGTFVAWKGRRDPDEERDGDAAALALGLGEGRIVPVKSARGADHRHLYLYSKVRETPERYPRRAGMARKRPLSA